MLDQENKTHVEQSTLNTDSSCKLSSSNPSTFDNNPLNDHDYCSKVKQPAQPQQRQQPQQQNQKSQQKKQPQQTRVRKPRQNTSVTDKSQWITGEEQVDSALSEHIGNGRQKRQRKEVHDPVFGTLSSSEYSSSDAGSDPESESDSEEDPNRPWCICEQPDDGTFMIECEICKYWFHGRCVGMTEALAKRKEKEKKEWYCSNCDHALQSGTSRDAIPLRLDKKEKKKISSRKKRRRGRPRKSETRTSEVTTRLSLRSAKRANSSVESDFKTEVKSNARVESFKKFDDQQRLRELIQERKREFFRKHRLNEQLKLDKMKEMSLGRQSISGSIGHSLDSVATTTNSPNMNNLPINIKSEHKERPKPNIVLQINTKKDGCTETSGQRMVTAIVKERKLSETSEPTKNELLIVDPPARQSVENSPSSMSPNALFGMNTSYDDGDESKEEEEEDELYDPEIPTIPEHTSTVVEKTDTNNQCWSGTITMSEVGKFDAFARPVSGDLGFMKDDISRTLLVCGRIASDNATSYIKKIKSTRKNQISLVQLFPLTENDRATFNAFFDHLYTRNRYGVINTNGHKTVLKDFYVLPIHEKGHIPEVIRPTNGLNLDRKETNCLLGLLVRSNRPNSATSSNLSYTPPAIK